jgi:hypothetical protein
MTCLRIRPRLLDQLDHGLALLSGDVLGFVENRNRHLGPSALGLHGAFDQPDDRLSGDSHPNRISDPGRDDLSLRFTTTSNRDWDPG